MLKTLAAAIVLLFSGASQVGVANAQPPAGDELARFQIYNAFGDLLLRVMQDRFCEKHGLDCSGILTATGPIGIQAMMGNSLDFTYAAPDFNIRAIAGGLDARMILGLASRVPYHVMVRSDLSWPNKTAGYPAIMKDMKGKRIGVTARGAGVELAFDVLLRSAGMSPNDVIYVGVGGPPTAYGALQSKQIDALILFQPMPGICKQSKICESILDLSKGEGPESLRLLTGAAQTIMAKRATIENNPKFVREFVAAAKDAEEWMKKPANYVEVKAIAAHYIKLTIPDADAVLDGALQESISNTTTDISRDALRAYMDLLVANKLLEHPVPLESVLWSEAPGK